MNDNTIKLFVGDEISDRGERQLITRLQRDLAAAGVPATVYANFFPPARRTGQVDVFVRTPMRTAHLEVKSLGQAYPVLGGPNGPWEQMLPDGTRRFLDKNAGRQALDGTFAIGDAMRDLARTGAVRDADFKRCIDTLVAMWPTIPAGSDIQPPPHVTVVGYSDLVERLTAPGPVIDWTEDEWDEFVRHVNMFQPESESPKVQRRRTAAEAIADYRLRAQASLASEIEPLIDLGALGTNGERVTFADVDRMVAEAAVVALIGPSGSGKSFAARHLALRQCDAGRLVIWLRAGEYEKGRFSNLVARAMAPFSAERWSNVIRPAPDAGVAVTVVLDGLNECPADLRRELLEQLQAFVLRFPAGVLVTGTEANGLAEMLGARLLEAGVPDATTRNELLCVHGARRPERISAQFQTPYELAIAARCECELGDDSTVADLYAAYIRRFAGSEQLRSGLRALAAHLHAKLRSSATLLEATAVLHGATARLTPAQVDDVLACNLLDVQRQRVQFRHELLGQFLAAEHLVLSAPSGLDLGSALTAPANRILASVALAIETDAHRTWEALAELADPTLIFAALIGDYGPEVVPLVAERVRDVLRLGMAATDAAIVDFKAGDLPFLGRWAIDVPWTPLQQALLAVAGRGLRMGCFFEEVCALVDRTDAVSRHFVRKLADESAPLPVSSVVASTYSQAHAADGHDLAGSYVIASFELSSMGSRNTLNPYTRGLARRFADTSEGRPWGRLYLAALAIDSDDLEDQATFASLLRRCWDAGGYHVRLQALWAAECFGRSDEPHRTEILRVINELETENVALRSCIVEVLARFGEIDSGLTVEDLRGNIREILNNPEDGDHCIAASGVVSSQFEDEDIVGPYCEAIHGLTEAEKVRLFTMAARGADIRTSMSLDWTLDHLCALVPTGDPWLDEHAKGAFALFLDGPPADAVMPIDAAKASIAAVRGWARFNRALPPIPAGLSAERRNWRLVAALLLGLERQDTDCDPAETWRELHSDRHHTVLTFSSLDGVASWSEFEKREAALHQLFRQYPDEFKVLFEWALDHSDVVLGGQVRRRGGRDQFVIRALGYVGDMATVERLRVHVLDPEAGDVAVKAIRQIHERLQA